MPEIKFTVTPSLPRDIVHLAYKAGDVVELPEASCQRWIRRGVAEFHFPVKAEKSVEKAVAKKAEVVDVKVEEPVADKPEGETKAEPADKTAFALVDSPAMDKARADHATKRGRRK